MKLRILQSQLSKNRVSLHTTKGQAINFISLMLQLRLALNLRASSLSLLSAEITGVPHTAYCLTSSGMSTTYKSKQLPILCPYTHFLSKDKFISIDSLKIFKAISFQLCGYTINSSLNGQFVPIFFNIISYSQMPHLPIDKSWLYSIQFQKWNFVILMGGGLGLALDVVQYENIFIFKDLF